jgi:acetyl/propionyl-CoA carboxylase alpha subunit
VPPPPIRLVHGGRTWAVRVNGSRVTPDDGSSVIVRDEGDGRFVVEGSEGTVRVIFAVEASAVWTGVEGHAIDFRIERRGQGRSAARDQDALSAPMPATVVRIQVRAGDRVEAGDTLVVLEAMKMELPIRAPRAAVVAAVRCEEGRIVQPDAVLVELE